MTTPPAGWYDDTQIPGRQRWFDGSQWTDHYQSAPAPQPHQRRGPMTSAPVHVLREVVYNRQQAPHSMTKWILLTIFTGGLTLPWMIYYWMSPNHYWTA